MSMKDKTMKDNILELVDLLLKHKLTANQFIFLYLKINNMDEKLYRYLETTRPLSKNELFDLEEKGFIVNINQSADDYWADGFVVSDRFIKAFEPNTILAEEFWDTFPGFFINQGFDNPLKTIPKKEFLFRYAAFVETDNKLHHRIMRALRFQKGKGEVKSRIERWFDNHTWEQIEEELDQVRKKADGKPDQ